MRRELFKGYIGRLSKIKSFLVADTPSPDMLVQVEDILDGVLLEMREYLKQSRLPEPTMDQPDFETLEEWMAEDGGCEATDGCWVEPDGRCPHGHPSWFLKLGLI